MSFNSRDAHSSTLIIEFILAYAFFNFSLLSYKKIINKYKLIILIEYITRYYEK